MSAATFIPKGLVGVPSDDNASYAITTLVEEVATEPRITLDLGVNLPLGIYLGLYAGHLIAHQRILREPHRSQAIVRACSVLLATSLVLLPLWRGVNPEHPLVDMGVSFGCAFTALRVVALTVAVTRARMHAPSDERDKTDKPVRVSTLRAYIRELYFSEPTRQTGLDLRVASKDQRPADPVLSALSALVRGYDVWVDRLGWNALPSWARYLLRPLLYFGLAQIPLAYTVRHIDYLYLFSMDPTAAVQSLGVSWPTAIGRWLMATLSLMFALYLTMLMWYGIVFDLIFMAVGIPSRRDLFYRPWMSASPRDLWSSRWNLPVQSALTTTVYLPVCQALDTIMRVLLPGLAPPMPLGKHRQPQKPAVKDVPPTTVTATVVVDTATSPTATILPVAFRLNRYVAAFSVFLVSALIHEYTLAAAFGRSDYDHLRFFCFHGGVVFATSMAEMLLSRILPASLMPRGRLPFVLGWLLTFACLVVSAQWFFRPFIRGGLVDSLVYYALL
ncbi:hypothetical protein THASP1DRAFT_25251 [Thamnocephalis sphaerospora]|uniref:Wax synthase domain-containing protein n=1 Tax=Thamnocephalis sphaerospora TaxID=78915 RepID=A0A4P9XM38_9FUNG|nr:hypothetical protein THASP1DRAFT_25251 [Thamnocephalis sphaerospora]|eukprot:RKP06421.1 hypothetical protein THASP1DRAFT_25251 [Thamnocephalis sphaerospora]